VGWRDAGGGGSGSGRRRGRGGGGAGASRERDGGSRRVALVGLVTAVVVAEAASASVPAHVPPQKERERPLRVPRRLHGHEVGV
jgi:hypothetical protein